MNTSSWISTSMPYLTPREPGQGDAWSADAAAQGRRGSQRIVHAGEVPAPTEVARLLGVQDGEPVVVRRRLILLDDEPNELTDTYYPAAIARGTPLAGTAKIRGGAVSLLAYYPLGIARDTPLMDHDRIKGGTASLLRQLGHTPQRCVDRISARVPTQEQFEALRLPGSLPVLCTLRVVYAADGRPIEATSMVKAGHLYELQYEFAPE